MSDRYDIIVVGAGLIGTTLALHLAKNTSLSVALVERNAPIVADPNLPLDVRQTNQRVVALGHLAVEMLTDIDVFQRLAEPHAHPYQSMAVWDENSKGDLHFSASDAGASELGYMVDAQACTRALQANALTGGHKNVTCFFSAAPRELTLTRGGARLQGDGFDLRARLAIGADGGRSWVRHQAKLFANRRSYGQQGIVAKIKTSNSHQNCAWQRFLSTGPVAALPVYDNYSSIVWSADNAFSKELMGMSDSNFSVALGNAFEQRLGTVIELDKRQAFPLVSLQASTYYSTSLALVGDAAHSIHPLAGQGANLGFKDALCLSQMIAQVPKDDIGELAFLHAYQQKRKPDNQQTDWMMTALNAGYKVNPPLWSAARGMGMNWVNSQRNIKALLAKQAMGLT